LKERLVFCWSGGKDSALALHKVRNDSRYDVVSLLTTCNEHFQRVSMHGVRVGLARRQADEIGIPLDIIYLSESSSNDEYEAKMREYSLRKKAEGITGMVFGDIFLEDLRRWREANLNSVGLYGKFPLWGRNTSDLIEEFLSLGFGSIVCCASDAYFDEAAVGQLIDRRFIDRLPKGVDPCGENGEFHSFAFKGPIFARPIPFKVGAKVYRAIAPSAADASCSSSNSSTPRGFWFCDLLEA
jgi:uncharacterized protein (TIGR00290 family)